MIFTEAVSSAVALTWWERNSMPILYGILVVTVIAVFFILRRKE